MARTPLALAVALAAAGASARASVAGGEGADGVGWTGFADAASMARALGVLATAFGFAPVFALDRTILCRVEVKGLGADRIDGAADAYRGLIEEQGGDVIGEDKSPSRSRVRFLFRAPYRLDLGALDRALAERVDGAQRGSVNWTVD